jgi:hypothetical protein
MREGAHGSGAGVSSLAEATVCALLREYDRLFLDFDGTLRIVSIEEVRKRDERTY